MSIADKAAFAKAKSTRRYKKITVPTVQGEVLIRSLKGTEFAVVKAAMQRAVMAANSTKASSRKRAAQATAAGTAEIVIASVVNENHEPMFSASDRAEICSWDAGVLESLESQISEHCGLDDLDLGDSAKNSSEASGDNSDTDSL